MLNHINYKMPIYKDCTLGEVIAGAITSYLVLIILFSLLTKLLVGYLWPGYLLASMIFVFVTKAILSKLQKLKYGKPYGYYRHLFIRALAYYGIISPPYLTRIGKWSTRRYLS